MEDVRKYTTKDLLLRIDFVGRTDADFTYRYFIRMEDGGEFQCHARHKDAYDRVLRCIRGEDKFNQKGVNIKGYTYRQALLTLYCDGLVQHGKGIGS